MNDFKSRTLAASFFATFAFLTIARAASEGHGWTNLFNGSDLSGWTQTTGTAKYFVEDGCIVGETVAGRSPNSFLRTEKLYDNFILELDFNVDPRLNSGVQFRSTKAEQETKLEWNGKAITIPPGYVYGYQVEIDPDVPRGRMWTGGIYDERRRAVYLFPDDGESGPHGKAFSEQGRKIFKPNEWNYLRLEAVGDSIKTYLNGVLCSDLHDSMTAKGFIGLQVHDIGNDKTKEGARIRFKNIRLQAAKPSSQKAQTAPNTLTKSEKNAGWRLLWDGKSTDGWRSPKGEDFPKQGWTIEDGELRVQAIGSAESAAGGDIITRERFSDFELMVDFKLTPGANSGIKYFVQPNLAPIGSSGTQAAGSAIGLEYQLLDDARHPDAKFGRDGNRTVSSLYDLITASATKPIKAIGDWNTARIVSRGRHVEHWLNGQKVVEYDRGSPAYRELVKLSKYKDIPNFGEWADGHILLQEHGNVVAFRNIKIRVPTKSAAVHRK